jgi:CBS domain-containing protein
MVHLLIVILDDLSTMPRIFAAWRKIGLPGATILQSAGAYRATTWLSRVGLGALDRLFDSEEVRRRTLLMAVEDDELLEKAIAEAEQAVGGFDRPNSGLLLVLPVAQVRGIHKVQPKPQPEKLPLAIRSEWALHRDMCVGDVMQILRLEAALVRQDAPLDEVARVILAHPRVPVVAVVNEEGRLIGILNVHTVADGLFFHIMPEEFLSKVIDLDDVMKFAAQSGMRSAEDAMLPPISVKSTDKVRDAFKRMHEHDLVGLPVVDDRYHVIGYIDLLELMAACLDSQADQGQGPSA